MKIKNKVFLSIIENYFSHHEHNDIVELETWTDRGVNMFVTIRKDSKKSFFKQFKEYVENFDIDEEIDLHRQDKLYKSHFSISQSVKDFEKYKEHLENILDELENMK